MTGAELDVSLSIPFWLESIAVLCGGMSGSLHAVRARYDLFGVICIAFLTGLGGGILRDILLQNYGIYAFQQPIMIVYCIIAGFIMFYFSKFIMYFDPFVDFMDALSTAMWSIIGASKGLSAGLGFLPSIILGLTTAVGGGILRDICMNREPSSFKAGPYYVTAALVGTTVFAAFKYENILPNIIPLLCVILILIIRYASLFMNWETKPATDYSDAVARTIKRPVKSVAKQILPSGKLKREKERNFYVRFLNRWHEITSHATSLATTGIIEELGVEKSGDSINNSDTSNTVEQENAKEIKKATPFKDVNNTSITSQIDRITIKEEPLTEEVLLPLSPIKRNPLSSVSDKEKSQTINQLLSTLEEPKSANKTQSGLDTIVIDQDLLRTASPQPSSPLPLTADATTLPHSVLNKTKKKFSGSDRIMVDRNELHALLDSYASQKQN